MFETGSHPAMSRQGLGKVAPAHPCARDISASLHVAAPAHPCARGISASMHVTAPARLEGC